MFPVIILPLIVPEPNHACTCPKVVWQCIIINWIKIVLSLLALSLLVLAVCIYFVYPSKHDYDNIRQVVVKMFDFRDKKASKQKWISSPFFVDEERYKICLRVDAAGYGDGKGTHVSVYLHFMKRPYDDKLEESRHWPLRGTFTIELLNQYPNGDHYARSMLLSGYLCSECVNRVFDGNMTTGLGFDQFISHDIIPNYINHLIDDALYFNITYEDNNNSLPNYQTAPLVMNMTKFAERKRNREQWYSAPFFAFDRGYLMCVQIYAAGYGDGEGTHVSVFLHLMKGPHDDELEQSGNWILKGTFTIELLNLLNNSDHYSNEIVLYGYLRSQCNKREVEDYMSNVGHGHHQFVSHKTIYYNYRNDYLNKNILSFRIKYNSIDTPNDQAAPVILVIPSFIEKIKNGKIWYSHPFFIFKEGYQMCLRVDAAGYGDGKGTHVSVYLHLMKGPHDDKLEQSSHWPMRGVLTIELLNQYENGNHYTRSILLSNYLCSECINRIMLDNITTGMGFDQFISHDIITDYINHLIDDALYFNITYEDNNNSLPNYQTAPLVMNMTKFAERKRNREQWYSIPFFAFDRGYLMCVQIYAAGYGDGEGTHVSVFLHLMKGPHDNELEQSGNWPLRGTFTIELLNLFNDSDHYSNEIILCGYLRSHCNKREVEDYMSNVGHGNHRFMSHKKIFYDYPKIYLIKNILFFRIKYKNNNIPKNKTSPAILVVPSFTEKMKNKKSWYSNPFFIFKEGYQMCLRVDADGYGDGKGTHMSVYLHLMKGPHDDKLEKSDHWPMRGTLTIELLNQYTNRDHYTRSMLLSGYLCRECINRVLNSNMTTGVGFDKFISHNIITDYINHLIDDALKFNITYEDNNDSLPSYQTPPLVMNMTKFAERKRNREQWYSTPFFAFNEGYLMCVQIYAAGYGDGEGTHVSVFLHLMKGPHDDKLEQSGHWPLRGKFTIELLNQLSSHNIAMYDYLRSQCTGREVEDYMNIIGFGYHRFLPHDVIFYKRPNDYPKGNNLTFIINYEKFDFPLQINQVSPVIFVMPHFTEKMKNKRHWFSSPFFTFKGGYQMCLRVVPVGYFSDEDTDVLVLLYLMKGPHDDKLEKSDHLPLRGTFTIEVLNQVNDSDHFVFTISLYHYLCNKCTDRVIEGDIAPEGWGSRYYISRNAILHQNNRKYFNNDALQFRISYEKEIIFSTPQNQVTPVVFQLCNVTSKIKRNEVWFSVPFFAYKEGYKVTLVMRMNGYKTGKSTHISFYVRLMKGPHDDKLEQLGHWPLRGTFTIKLLSQLNDSDHHSHKAEMNYNKCGRCTNRVLKNNIASTGWGSHRFISHKAIFQDDKYLKNNCAEFRISYEDTGYSTLPLQIAPVKLKMSNVSENIKSSDRWYSEEFLAFKAGYKFHLRVYGSGYRDGEGSHLSVFLCLMKGPYDDTLDWPMSGTFIIELLDQCNNSDSYIRKVVVYGYLYGACTDRVKCTDISDGDTVPECCHFKFMPHEKLYSKSIPLYLKDNSLLFKVSYEHNPPLSHEVAPVVLNISNFTNKLKSREHWSSSPFYAFEGGYRMCVSIDFSGGSDNKNTYISIFIHPLNGPFDNKLQQSGQWPTNRIFLIELIYYDGEYDRYCLQKEIYFLVNETCESCALVIKDIAEGYGNYYMIPLKHVHAGLKNDEIFIKISQSSSYTWIFLWRWSSEDLLAFIALLLIDGLSTFVIIVVIEACRNLFDTSPFAIAEYYVIAQIVCQHAMKSSLFVLSIVICRVVAFMMWEFVNVIDYSSAALMNDMLNTVLTVYLYSQLVNIHSSSTIASPVWMMYMFSDMCSILDIITLILVVIAINILLPLYISVYLQLHAWMDINLDMHAYSNVL